MNEYQIFRRWAPDWLIFVTLFSIIMPSMVVFFLPMANVSAAAGYYGCEPADIQFAVILFYAGYAGFYSLERRFFSYLAAKEYFVIFTFLQLATTVACYFISDLYLLYSEALNEVKAQPDGEVYQWIDKVRAAAGLNGVVSSWQMASYNASAPATKEGMRKIIQRERLIELSFEGQRFWDVRRWKLADKYWTLPPTTWSLTATQPDQFYVPAVSGSPRVVTFRDYLYPIRKSDIRVNTNLVQTYGWQ